MGLLQGDQVTRFALPPPPGAAPTIAQPPTTADPAVVASQPKAALPPATAAPIVLPAPEAPPRPNAGWSAVGTVPAAAEQQMPAELQQGTQSAGEAQPEPTTRPQPAAMAARVDDGQQPSDDAAHASDAAANEGPIPGESDTDNSLKIAHPQPGPMVQSATESPEQASEDAAASPQPSAARSSPVAAADGEASARPNNWAQPPPSVPRGKPALDAMRSTPHARPERTSDEPGPLSEETTAAASSPLLSPQANGTSVGYGQGRVETPLNRAAASPKSAVSGPRSPQPPPSPVDVSHAQTQELRNAQAEKPAEQVDYGPLGPLG